MTIFLVGSMGVGKSAVGKKLANNMEIAFSDTDDMLIAQQGLSINEIFREHGEPYFRELESKLLTEMDYTKSQLIATGGGLPITGTNMEYMKGKGIVVYLKAAPVIMAARLYQERYKRPTIKDLSLEQVKDKLKTMLDARTPTYERAHLTFLRSEDLFADVFQLSTYLKMYI